LAEQAADKQGGGWLSKLRAGDHQAFAAFVDRFKERVFLCCRTLGLKDDEAQDVASETFLAAYRAISRYRGQAKLDTWLWAIAYRQAVSYLRKNRRHMQLLGEPAEQVADSRETGPATAVQVKEKQQIVWEAVEQLPRVWAVAIILFYREQKSIKDIAKIMKKRQNTVKTYLFRARKRLKQTLEPILGDTDVG